MSARFTCGGIPVAQSENSVGPQQALPEEQHESNEAHQQNASLENQPLIKQPLEAAQTGVLSPISSTSNTDSGFISNGSQSDLLNEVAHQLVDQQATEQDESGDSTYSDSGSATPTED